MEEEEQNSQSGVGDAKLLEEDGGIMLPLTTQWEGTNNSRSPAQPLELSQLEANPCGHGVPSLSTFVSRNAMVRSHRHGG